MVCRDGCCKSVDEVLPNLLGKLTGNAIRVPTPNVSMAILNLRLKPQPLLKKLMNTFVRCLFTHHSANRLVRNSAEVVSSDFVGSRRACVFDAQATIVNENNAVLYIWYDNEFGYTCQVHRVMEKMAGVSYNLYPPN